MSSRLASRAAILPRAAANRLLSGPRRRPSDPQRILVAHQLLLGDTLMLTPMLARLRRRYPAAQILMTVAPRYLPLYAPRPYRVEALGCDLRDSRSVQRVIERAPFDLALVPGDNRYALLALAAGARWIVALADDRPQWKNRIVDERVPLPQEPTVLSDLFALLAGPEDGARYDPRDWPRPQALPFELPRRDYAVLHVGAGSALRLWQPHKWRAVAQGIERLGLQPVFCAGAGEEAHIADADPQRRYPAYAGTLALAQLWRLLESARLLVCLDSGASHLAKLAGTPTVVLYGPGTPSLFGPGRFFGGQRFRAVTVADFPCRDQKTVFKREVSWVRRCQRTLAECPAPACMHAIEVDAVLAACAELLG